MFRLQMPFTSIHLMAALSFTQATLPASPVIQGLAAEAHSGLSLRQTASHTQA